MTAVDDEVVRRITELYEMAQVVVKGVPNRVEPYVRGRVDALAEVLAQLQPAEPEVFDWYARVAWDDLGRVRTGERSLDRADTVKARRWIGEMRAGAYGHIYSVDALYRRPPLAPWDQQPIPADDSGWRT